MIVKLTMPGTDEEQEIVVHSMEVTFADMAGELHSFKVRLSNDHNYLHINADNTMLIRPVAANCAEIKTVRWR